MSAALLAWHAAFSRFKAVAADWRASRCDYVTYLRALDGYTAANEALERSENKRRATSRCAQCGRGAS